MQRLNQQRREPMQLGIKIQVDAVAMQKFWAFTDIARGEVSCLGLVEEIRDESTGMITALIVTDFLLVKQQCSLDETTMDSAAVAELITRLESQGIDSRKLRCWAHSHGGMSVFWSGTDDECIAGLANGEWMLSLVVNKKHDAMMRLDQYNPAHLYVTDVVFEIAYPLVDGLAAECLQEFKSKVSETAMIRSNGRVPTNTTAEELLAARERGALTLEELRDELDWMGLESEDREQPF